MTWSHDDGVLRLAGTIGVRDAAGLLAACEEVAAAHDVVRVDLSDCEHLHAAALQALHVVGAVLEGLPDDPFFDLVATSLSSRRNPPTDPGADSMEGS